MKSNRIIVGVAGVLLFLSIVLTFTWLLTPSNSNQTNEISFDEARIKLTNGEVKEVLVKSNTVELIDIKSRIFYTKLGSDPTREALINEIRDFNKINTSAPIKYSEEPTSSGWRWILLVNSSTLLIPFFIMWGLTLAVIVYAVRALSRNKG